MINKLTARELKAKITAAIINSDKSIAAFTGSTNPQTQAMLTEAKAQREAFDAVLSALNGNTWLLNTYSKQEN